MAFYIAIACISIALFGLFWTHIQQGVPTDPEALNIRAARHTYSPLYRVIEPPQLAGAPSVMLPHRIDQGVRNEGGFYWYAFDFYSNTSNNHQAIYIPRLAMNAEVYANGNLVGYFGPITGEQVERNWNRPQYIHLGASEMKPGMNTIAIQVRAFPNYMSGLSDIWIGSDQSMRSAYLSRLGLQVTLVFISTSFVIGAGIVLIMLSALRVKNRKRLLILALACVLWSVRNLAFLATQIPLPHDLWVRMAQCSLLMFASTVLWLVLDYCKVHSRRWEWKFWWAYSLSFPVLMFTGSIESLQLVQVYGGVALLIYFWLMVLLFRHGNTHHSMAAHVFTFGLLCFNLLSISDLLLLAGVRPFNGHFLNQYMGLVIFLVLSYFLLDRYSRLLRDADTFNETLKQRLAQRELELERQFLVLQQTNDEKVKLSERQRLMLDMHDGIGAHLVSAMHQLRSPNFSREQTLQMIETGLRDLQLTIDSLEPMDENLTTLLGSFRYRMADSLRAANIELEWKIDENIPALQYLDPRNSLQVLRILQEVFTNILKHAQATRVSVHVFSTEHAVGVQIRDNGVGFDMKKKHLGKGLRSIQQRAANLQARAQIESSPGQGTSLLLELRKTQTGL